MLVPVSGPVEVALRFHDVRASISGFGIQLASAQGDRILGRGIGHAGAKILEPES